MHTGGRCRKISADCDVRVLNSDALTLSLVTVWWASNASSSIGSDATNDSESTSASRRPPKSSLHSRDSSNACGESVCSVHAISSRAASTFSRHASGNSPCGVLISPGAGKSPSSASRFNRRRSDASTSAYCTIAFFTAW